MRLAIIAAAALAAVFASSDAVATVAKGPRAVPEPNVAAIDRVTDGTFNDADAERFLRAAQDEDDSVPKDEFLPEERGPGTPLSEKVAGLAVKWRQSAVGQKVVDAQVAATSATKAAAGYFNKWYQNAYDKFKSTVESALKGPRDDKKLLTLKEKFLASVDDMRSKIFNSGGTTPQAAAARPALGDVSDAAAPSLLTRLDQGGGKLVDDAIMVITKGADKLAINDKLAAVKTGAANVVGALQNLKTRLMQKPAAADGVAATQSTQKTFTRWLPKFLETVNKTVKGAFEKVKGNKLVDALKAGITNIADFFRKMNAKMFQKAAAVDDTAAGGAATLKAPEKRLSDNPIETLGTPKDIKPKVE